MQRSFWTLRRFTGFILILGCFLFLGGAGMTPMDAQGNYSVLLPDRARLLVIAAQTTRFQWSTCLFLSGIFVTALGFALLSRLLWDSQERTFSYLALIASLLGVALVVIDLALGLGVDPFAAQATARTGVVPTYFEPLTLWGTALFRIYTLLAFLALALYGGALLVSRLLPRWLGWAAMVYAVAGLGLFAYAHDVPPFFHFLLPIVMGVTLLLPPHQAHAQAKPVGASTLVPETAP